MARARGVTGPRRLALALLVASGPVAAASPAWGLCPNCLGQNATLTASLRLVGVFLLIPPAIAFLVARVIRHLQRHERRG